MPTPRSIRFDADTLEALAAFAARHAGLSISSAAALLVEEGLRMDAHPGVVFQEGPTGRRLPVAEEMIKLTDENLWTRRGVAAWLGSVGL